MGGIGAPAILGALALAALAPTYDFVRARFGEAVVLVHGQLRPEVKDAAMERFASGDARLLIATTVIEVGVDVPNASLMVIEHAERFGLAQLHQLRGRVGRGAKASSCILLYGGQDGALGETARERLETLRRTDVIAWRDAYVSALMGSPPDEGEA